MFNLEASIGLPNNVNAWEKLSAKKLKYLKYPKNPKLTKILAINKNFLLL